jgi:hypothetical protein
MVSIASFVVLFSRMIHVLCRISVYFDGITHIYGIRSRYVRWTPTFPDIFGNVNEYNGLSPRQGRIFGTSVTYTMRKAHLSGSMQKGLHSRKDNKP